MLLRAGITDIIDTLILVTYYCIYLKSAQKRGNPKAAPILILLRAVNYVSESLGIITLSTSTSSTVVVGDLPGV